MLEQGNAGKSFYGATKKLSEPGGGQKWAVSNLFNKKDPEHICNEILAYFGGISGTTEQIGITPTTGGVTGCLPEYTSAQVAQILKNSKKTQSQVKGDPLPQLLRMFPSAEPVAAIFNNVNRSVCWPKKWKTEYLTIIPKVPNPADVSECSNISCMSVLSKILENRVLEQLRGELVADDRQYGRAPKCGAVHLLIELWDKILDCVDGGGNAAVLLGVDFEKVFNRMDHGVCLSQLKKTAAWRWLSRS